MNTLDVPAVDALQATTPIPPARASQVQAIAGAGDFSDATGGRYRATEIATPMPPQAHSGHLGHLAQEQAAASASAAPLSSGDIIDGKYQIDRVLGEGGMGTVFAATHLQLREPVALKFMNAAAVANPEASARFVREARAAARLRGEHVCRVLDLGETPEGARYIVIEYLDGKDLDEVLKARGALTIAESIEYILQACEAMAEAHGAGIVHRDLKPANLFLATGTDGAPCIKVVDFGISKLINPETNAQVVTTTRSLMGSPLYMAPEQLVSAKEVDSRADIWALGTVLFQLVAGRTPYEATSLPEVVAQVLHNDPPKLSAIVPGSPKRLDAIIDRCLAKKKEERYASVADLASDLAELAPQASHLAMRSAAVLGAGRHSTVIPTNAGVSGARSLVKPLVAIGVLAVAIGVALFFLLSGDSDVHTDETGPREPVRGEVTDVDTSTKQAPVPGTGAAGAQKDAKKDGIVVAPTASLPTSSNKLSPATSRDNGKSSAKAKGTGSKAKAKGTASKSKAKSTASKAKAKSTASKTNAPGDLLAPDLSGPAKKPKASAKPKSKILEPDL